MHQGSAGVQGTAFDVESQAANLAWTKNLMTELNAQFTGQSVQKIATDSDRDHWFAADEARDYVFVDHVVASLHEVRRPSRRTGLGY
jgi:ATP-dependent Clp protease protease subunit